MSLNLFLLIAMTLLLVGFMIFIFRKRTDVEEVTDLVYTFEELDQYTENVILDAVATNYFGRKDADFHKRERQRLELNEQLKTAGLGDRGSKMLVKSFIKDKIGIVYGFTDETINKVIPFHRPERMTDKDLFDILLYHLSKEHGKNAFAYMMETFKLDKLRDVKGSKRSRYLVDGADIQNIYYMIKPELDLNDKLEIIVQRVYEQYKGRGPIDELLDQKIDGVSGGVSGVPVQVKAMIDLESYEYDAVGVPASYEAVWCMYRGNSYHLRFLSFGTQDNLVRICQNIYTYDSPGQFNQQKGFMVNEMANQSRVLVVGPKYSDSWAFFVRNFDGSIVEHTNLYPKIKNIEIFYKWQAYSFMAAITLLISGMQGTGKTSVLKAFVDFYYPEYNVRVQGGSSFESWLRIAYPERNLISVRKTAETGTEESTGALKKSDGTITANEELALPEDCISFLDNSSVASLAGVGTHHGKTTEEIVVNLTNAAMSSGRFTDRLFAEAYVAQTLKQDTHLENIQGFRHPSRVTEIIPVDEVFEIPTELLHPETKDEAIIAMAKVYMQDRKYTHRKMYRTQNLMEYRDGAIVVTNRPSQDLLMYMLKQLREEDREGFIEFVNETFPPGEELKLEYVG